ncbi:MAG: hydroxyacid dehydrogenase [Rhodospirillaceae bacterium]|nr:hydroxyacid dehydrogenase [Rhodospirillaceae bacterium]|tara:strand:+ start:597 stop:2027 length:1431 start_codon:yes stop_codon:yes gene_type:complete
MKKNSLDISKKNIDDLKSICGKGLWVEDIDLKKQYLTEQRGYYKSSSQIILKPNSTKKVSNILRYCNGNNIPVVPQGGNTGLVGGAVAGYVSNEIILNLENMNKIREISHSDSLITAEAGVTLHKVQSNAESINKIFPLSLASEGTCQIGGNLATNAGGVHVIKYGNAKDLVLGLEVVLADGTIFNDLKKLRKDNSGYNINQLFIGSEGTLGIITAATLKLFPKPVERHTILVALDSIDSAIDIMNQLKKLFFDKLSALEFFSDFSLEIAMKFISKLTPPFNENYPWYILIDIEETIETTETLELIENFLYKNLQKDIIKDGLISKNLKERNELWQIRESIPYAQKSEGASIKHDVSVPLSNISDFLVKTLQKVSELIPNIRPCIFGHLGDGNIHFNLTKPPDIEDDDFLKFQKEINKIIYDSIFQYEGSISAEHGVGLLKNEDIKNYKRKSELKLMFKMKNFFDPKNILNPGKLI